jgi:hypothetical protein
MLSLRNEQIGIVGSLTSADGEADRLALMFLAAVTRIDEAIFSR